MVDDKNGLNERPDSVRFAVRESGCGEETVRAWIHEGVECAPVRAAAMAHGAAPYHSMLLINESGPQRGGESTAGSSGLLPATCKRVSETFGWWSRSAVRRDAALTEVSHGLPPPALLARRVRGRVDNRRSGAQWCLMVPHGALLPWLWRSPCERRGPSAP